MRLSEDRIDVIGLVNDIVTGGAPLYVEVNGIQAFTGRGSFLVSDLPLVRGSNIITALARDASRRRLKKQLPKKMNQSNYICRTAAGHLSAGKDIVYPANNGVYTSYACMKIMSSFF